MKICVLQSDYSNSDVDYQFYDPVRDLSPLMPEAEFDHILINKLTTYKQLRALSKKNYDIFVNLCEGYPDWNVPGIDVIHTLEHFNLPFTGPTSLLYDPPKELMKYVAYTEGILTPAFALIHTLEDIPLECAHLKYPLFVKPHVLGDSIGVDHDSLVRNEEELRRKCASILEEYGPLLVEEYIAGRELTVMLVANANDPEMCTVFKPIEYIFPSGFEFKTYSLKTSDLHPEANIPCVDPMLEEKLKEAAFKIFRGFGGVAYARLDFRVDDQMDIYFLDINFVCSVFYSGGYEGSADYILKCDGIGQEGFLRTIIAEGIARHFRHQVKYVMKGNAISGYGIYANQDIAVGEIVFHLEESSQRIVTRKYVEDHWNDHDKKLFRRYAYPLSREVYVLWDNNPYKWAPQNHSCEPNAVYHGLNVIAVRPIRKGEELTLDYAGFLDEKMEPFECHCGTNNCRKWITGSPGNSVTKREELRNA